MDMKEFRRKIMKFQEEYKYSNQTQMYCQKRNDKPSHKGGFLVLFMHPRTGCNATSTAYNQGITVLILIKKIGKDLENKEIYMYLY